MIHQLVAVVFKLVVTDEDLIIGLHVLHPVRKCVLSLRCQVSYHTVKDSYLNCECMLTLPPFVLFQEIQDALNHLEVASLWIAGYYHQEAKDRLKQLSHFIQVVHVVSLNFLARRGQPPGIGCELLIHGDQDCLEEGICLADKAIQESGLGRE
jgi:hypothetical protein